MILVALIVLIVIDVALFILLALMNYELDNIGNNCQILKKSFKKRKEKQEINYKKKYNELKEITDKAIYFAEMQNNYIENLEVRIKDLTYELNYYKQLFDRRN